MFSYILKLWAILRKIPALKWKTFYAVILAIATAYNQLLNGVIDEGTFIQIVITAILTLLLRHGIHKNGKSK